MDTHAQREKPPSSDTDAMSTSPASKSEKELKEEMLNRKMEEMKRKNEEMMKKHKLIEEDKRLAEQQGRSVTVKASKKENVSSSTTTAEENKKTKSVRTVGKDLRDSIPKQPQRVDEKDANKLSPPPDPSYNFLADRSREGPLEEERKEASRRHPRNFGGTDFEDVPKKIRDEKAKHMNRPLPREQIEYTICTTGKQRREMEEWRKEREKIDRERLERQKTNTGDWKRDWDKEKQSIDDLPYQQYDRTNVPFRNKAGHDNYNPIRDSFVFNEPENRRPAQNRDSFNDPSRRPDRDPFTSHATASNRRPMPDRDSFAFREMTSNQRPLKDRDSFGPHETTSNHRPMQDRDFSATLETNSNRRPVQDRDSAGNNEPNSSRRSTQDQDPFTRLETTLNRRPLHDRKSAGRVGSGRFALEQMSKSQNVKKVSPHYGSRFKLGTAFGSDDNRPNKYTAGSTHQDYYNNKTRRGYGRAQRNKDQITGVGRGVTIEDCSAGAGDNIRVHPVLDGDKHRMVQENQETIIVQIDNKSTTFATQQKSENVQAVKIENSGSGDNLGSCAAVPACRIPKELRTEKPVGSGRFGTQALGRTTRSPKQDQIQTDELDNLEKVKVGRSNKKLGFRTTRGASGRIQNVHVDRGEMNTVAQECDDAEKSDIEKVARAGRVGKSNLKSRNTRGSGQRMDKEHFEEYDNPEKITRVGRSGKLNAKLGSRTTRGRRTEMADDVAQSEERGLVEAVNRKCQENVENPDISKVQSRSKKVKKVGFILDAEVIEPPKIQDDVGSDAEQMSACKSPVTENEKVEEVNIGEDFGEDDNDDDDWEDIDEEVCLELDHGLETSTKDDSCSSQDISSESFDRFIKENTLQQKELEATKTSRDLASLIRPSSFQAILDWGAEMDSVYQLSEEENRNDDTSVSSGNTAKRNASAKEDDPSVTNDKLQHPDLETHEIQMEGFHLVICSLPMATPLETNFNISAFEASESMSENRTDLESVNFEKLECSPKVALDFVHKDGEGFKSANVTETDNVEGVNAIETENFLENKILDSNLDTAENCEDSDSKKTENFEQTKFLNCVSEKTENVKQDEILDSISKQNENLEIVEFFDSGCVKTDNLEQAEILHSVSENVEQVEILDSVSKQAETFEKAEIGHSVSENIEQVLDSVPKQSENFEEAEIVHSVSENVEQDLDSISKQTENLEQVEILGSVSETSENLEKKEIVEMTKNVEDSNSGKTEKFEEDANILDSDKGENCEESEFINSVPEIIETCSEGSALNTNLGEGEKAIILPTVSENLSSDDTNLTENLEDCNNLKTYHEDEIMENNRGGISELTTESSDNGLAPDSVQSASEETVQNAETTFPVHEGQKDSFVKDSSESCVEKSEFETTDESYLSGQKEISNEATNSSQTTE